MTIPNIVTRIGDHAFSRNKLSSVVIPNSVTSIGRSAFYLNQLTSVTIPDSVTSIGPYAFSTNELTSVTIPSSVTSIGEGAFRRNELTSVTIPNSVTSIGDRVFEANQLTSVIMPNSVTSIGNYAFYSNRLTSVTIPNSVTSIGVGAFYENQITSALFLGDREHGPSDIDMIGFQSFWGNPIEIINYCTGKAGWPGESIEGIAPNPFKSGCFSFDVDENLEAQPLTDGLLVIRHLFGFSGDSLTSGAVSGEAGRDSSEAIAGYLTDAVSELDIDGDGESKPLTDGLLLIRYLFGFSGDSLVSGAIGTDATRDTAEAVEAYIEERVPSD